MKPIFTHIIESHMINADCTIIQESCEDFPKLKSNIYCIHADSKVKWFAELPLKDDLYPNPIQINTRIDKNATEYGGFYVAEKGLFTTSSQNGITVTIDIKNGKIIDSEFTK
ncbi:MAG: hypothetical protein HRT58_06165 [Crocinitomicaceae bacterium]|nr:hypothetical protein [Flavobacteriales bacterium]NQZ35228.1 hypothetical protein [Crocinitomicaceae bacterium]